MTSSNAPSHAPVNSPRPGGTARFAGRDVSRIGYGAMQLERLHGDRRAAVAVLRHAIERGVDHIDTAQFYGNGFVNGLIREAIRPEDDVVIVSKVGADPDPDADPGARIPLRPAQRPEELRASVEDNLACLGLERIPVVNLRRLDVGPGLRASGDQVVDLDDQLAVMTAMRDEGKIGAIGLSGVTADGLRRALPAGIVCVQNAYSLLTREDEDLLDLCRAEGVAWVPFFPLGGAGAFVQFPKVTGEAAVVAAAKSLGRTPAQIGLAWLLHHSPNVLLIPGTTSIEHLDENIAVGEITFDGDTLAALDAVPSVSAEVPLG